MEEELRLTGREHLGLEVEEEVAGLRMQLPVLVRLEGPGAVRPLLPRLSFWENAAGERLLLKQVDVGAPLRPVDLSPSGLKSFVVGGPYLPSTLSFQGFFPV